MVSPLVNFDEQRCRRCELASQLAVAADKQHMRKQSKGAPPPTPAPGRQGREGRCAR